MKTTWLRYSPPISSVRPHPVFLRLMIQAPLLALATFSHITDWTLRMAFWRPRSRLVLGFMQEAPELLSCERSSPFFSLPRPILSFWATYRGNGQRKRPKSIRRCSAIVPDRTYLLLVRATSSSRCRPIPPLDSERVERLAASHHRFAAVFTPAGLVGSFFCAVKLDNVF